MSLQTPLIHDVYETTDIQKYSEWCAHRGPFAPGEHRPGAVPVAPADSEAQVHPVRGLVRWRRAWLDGKLE